MNPLNQIEIEEVSTQYAARMNYFSDKKQKAYEAKIGIIEYNTGKISLTNELHSSVFEFVNSDPDRVLAVATLMQTAAKMVKDHQKDVDTSTNV